MKIGSEVLYNNECLIIDEIYFDGPFKMLVCTNKNGEEYILRHSDVDLI